MNPLRDARFRRLAVGQALSSFGDGALYLVLAIWVKDLTGSNGRPERCSSRSGPCRCWRRRAVSSSTAFGTGAACS